MITSNPSIEMSQDLNPSICSSLVIFMYGVCERQGSISLVLRSKSSSGKCAELHTVEARNNRDHPTRSLYYCLFASHLFVCCSLRTSCLRWITLSMQRPLRGCNNILSVLQWTVPIACSFCGGCHWNHLHLLVTAPFCCDWKGQVASVQSFTLWQQATIDIPRHAHSIAACSHHIYMEVVLDAHRVCGESHIQHNAKREIAIPAASLG